jgi:hypothetical protein
MGYGDLNVCPEIISRWCGPRMFGFGKDYFRADHKYKVDQVAVIYIVTVSYQLIQMYIKNNI